MKAMLEFSLPEEEEEYEMCLQGRSLRLVVDEVLLWLRNEIKYKERADAETLHEVRERIWQALNDYEVKSP